MKYKVTRQELNECIAEAVARVIKENNWDKYCDADKVLSNLSNDPKHAEAQKCAKMDFKKEQEANKKNLKENEEDYTSSEDDEMLKNILANDKKAGSAFNAAKRANGIKPAAGTGKRGRPKKNDPNEPSINPLDVSDEELIDNMANVEDAEEKEPEYDQPEVGTEEGDDEDVFDREYGNMSSEDLIEIVQNNPRSSARYRGANAELKHRKNMIDAYEEDGCKPEWGYVYNPDGCYTVGGKPYKYRGTMEPTHVPKQYDGSIGSDAGNLYGGMNFGWGHSNAENYE